MKKILLILIIDIFSLAYAKAYWNSEINCMDGSQSEGFETFALGSPENPVSIERNWIRTKTFTKENGGEYITDIEYCDGLGYLNQSINIGASPQGNNIITPVYYDEMHRSEARTYLPYASGNESGSFHENGFAEQQAFYSQLYPGEILTYTENIYEASPLNRIVECYNVGAANRGLNDNKKAIDYLNNSTDEVLYYRVVPDPSGTRLTSAGYYGANTLHKEVITDEDGAVTTIYTDIIERTILQRIVGKDEHQAYLNYDTHYVYDDYGNLCYVLPPELSAAIEDGNVADLSDDSWEMEHYAYVYKYDSRNRCVGKRLPGTDWVDMVYDKGDRLVMNRDGNMRDKGEWIYTVYDNHSRPVCQNIIEDIAGLAPEQIQDKFNSASHVWSYPTLTDSWRLTVPFNESTFEHVAIITESIYGGYEYPSFDGLPLYLNYEAGLSSDNSSGSVLITEIMYDTPLNEQIATGHPYSNGEYIELFNATSSAVDLTGWKLTGGGSTEICNFPVGTTIPAKGYLIVAYQY